MPWMDDEYLVDTRDRTLTPVTPELRYELSRIKSSTRRVIKAVSGEFERFVREGYRVVQRAGEDLFRNPEYTEGPQNWDLRHVHYTSGSEVQATAKLLKRAGYKAEIQVNKGYGYGIYKVAKSWTLMTDASNNVVYLLDKFLKRKLTTWEERQFPDDYKLLSERLGYDLLDKQDQTAGEVGRGGVVKGKALNPYSGHRISQKPKGKKLPHYITMIKDPIGLWFKVDGWGDRRFTNIKEAEAAYHERRRLEDEADRRERESQPNRVVYDEGAGTITVYTDGVPVETKQAKSRHVARQFYNSGDYYDTHTFVMAGGEGTAQNPHYNVLTKTQFDALKQLNRAYPKGDVYLGEIRLARGEQFSDALVAVEKIQRSTGIAHDVVQFQGKYYSAPQAWVDKVLVDARMESRAARTPARPARSVSEQRGGGGIRGAVKAGWRELMSNPGFVRSDLEELGNALVISQEALKSGKVDGSGSRAIEMLVRRLGLSQREADYILELAGPGADNKRVADVWKGLEETDPQWSREETERLHDVRIDALPSPDWGRRGNPRGRGGRGGRSSKPMPYPWEMEVRAAYSPRFMSKDQYGELANLWHLSRVPASGTNWGRYERMLWTAKEFHKAHPEISEGAAYKDLDGLLSSGW